MSVLQSKVPLPDSIGIIPTAYRFMWEQPSYSQKLIDNVNRLFYQFHAKYNGQTDWSYGPTITNVAKSQVAHVSMHAEMQNGQIQPPKTATGQIDAPELSCFFAPNEKDTECRFSVLKNATRDKEGDLLDLRQSNPEDRLQFDLQQENVGFDGLKEDPVLSKKFQAFKIFEWDKSQIDLSIKGYFQMLGDAYRSKNITCSNQYPVEHFCLPLKERFHLEQNFVKFLDSRSALPGRFEYQNIDPESLVKERPYAFLKLEFHQKGFLPTDQKKGELREEIFCGSFEPNLERNQYYAPYCEFSSRFYRDGSYMSEKLQPSQSKQLNEGSLSIPSMVLLQSSSADDSSGLSNKRENRVDPQKGSSTIESSSSNEPQKPAASSIPNNATPQGENGAAGSSKRAQNSASAPKAKPQPTNPNPSNSSSKGGPSPSDGSGRFKLAATGLGLLGVMAIAYKALRKKEESSGKNLPKVDLLRF